MPFLFVLTFFIFELSSTAEAQVAHNTQATQRLIHSSEEVESTIDSLFCGPCIFFIPKLFTPKVDIIQGGWGIKPICDHTINSFNLEIYNYWGELLFETNDITEYWNGKEKGEVVNPGIYLYKITIEVKSNEKLVPGDKTGQIYVNTNMLGSY